MIRVAARAKINLTLRVLSRRADGFHDILSWMHPIDWADELTVRPSSQAGVRLICDDAAIPAGRDNLILRAAEALARRTGRDPAYEVELRKRLPMGGGLGGGSADAAAMLLAMARFESIDANDARLADAAAEIGSDVPFFLGRGAMLASGRGTALQSAPAMEGWAALVMPPFVVSTPAAYGACRPRPLTQNEPQPWRRRDAAASSGTEISAHSNSAHPISATACTKELVNDLTSAAITVEPRVAEVIQALQPLGQPVHMSGSGSTLFALFDDDTTSQAWAIAAAQRAPAVRLHVARLIHAPPCEWLKE